jgi:hypothetical protein
MRDQDDADTFADDLQADVDQSKQLIEVKTEMNSSLLVPPQLDDENGCVDHVAVCDVFHGRSLQVDNHRDTSLPSLE